MGKSLALLIFLYGCGCLYTATTINHTTTQQPITVRHQTPPKIAPKEALEPTPAKVEQQPYTQPEKPKEAVPQPPKG